MGLMIPDTVCVTTNTFVVSNCLVFWSSPPTPSTTSSATSPPTSPISLTRNYWYLLLTVSPPISLMSPPQTTYSKISELPWDNTNSNTIIVSEAYHQYRLSSIFSQENTDETCVSQTLMSLETYLQTMAPSRLFIWVIGAWSTMDTHMFLSTITTFCNLQLGHFMQLHQI